MPGEDISRVTAGADHAGAEPVTLPPLDDSVTDPVTARFCTETGHVCPACPQHVRNLAATAHNALGAVEAALAGTGGWDRAHRKMGGLRRSLETFREISDGHFAAMEEWRRP